MQRLLNLSKRRAQTPILVQVASRIAFCVGVAAIAAGSLLPSNYAPPVTSDKLEHFIAYFVLSLLGSWAFSNWRPTALALSLCLLAIALEAGQRYAPGRSMEIADVVASSSGVCSAVTVRFLASLLRA